MAGSELPTKVYIAISVSIVGALYHRWSHYLSV